jgi:hypothetical protein
MGVAIKNSVSLPGGPVFYPGCAPSEWVVVHSDLTANAESAGVLRQPGSYSNSAVRPLICAATAQRVLVRIRYATAITAITGLPSVQIYGGYGPDIAFNPETGVFDDTGLVQWTRLDAPGAAYGALQLGAAPVSDLRDTVYKYGDINGDQATTNGYGVGYELRGAKWVLVLVQTKATGLTGGSLVQCVAATLNYSPQAYAIPA